jgi:hypothetical protein
VKLGDVASMDTAAPATPVASSGWYTSALPSSATATGAATPSRRPSASAPPVTVIPIAVFSVRFKLDVVSS